MSFVLQEKERKEYVEGEGGKEGGREGGREGTHLVHGSLQARAAIVEDFGALGHIMLEFRVLGREGGRVNEGE